MNTIVVNPGANASVTPEYIESRQDIFNDARYCLIQMEIPFSSVETVIRICKEKQISVILKPSPAQKLPEHILKDLFLLIPNRDEMNILVPDLDSPEKQAEYMLSLGVENIIVTLAEKGCIFVDRLGVKSYPAVDFPSVDTRGASDIFISCLAAQLAKSMEMDDAIKMATIAASYSVSKEGVQNAIISSDLLKDLYRGNFSIFPGK